VAHVAEPGRLAVTLPVQTGLRVGRALVGLVRALLAVEVTVGVAARPPPSRSGPSWPSPFRSLPSLRRELLIEAQASISVPSTEK